jgi:hypothetical protein
MSGRTRVQWDAESVRSKTDWQFRCKGGDYEKNWTGGTMIAKRTNEFFSLWCVPFLVWRVL